MESATKFLLSLEEGIAFPLLMILSMLPDDRGVFPFRTSNLMLALGSYLMVRLMRAVVLLLYLVAHNYFLSKAF
jgi:hypothetical protein